MAIETIFISLQYFMIVKTTSLSTNDRKHVIQSIFHHYCFLVKGQAMTAFRNGYFYLGE